MHGALYRQRVVRGRYHLSEPLYGPPRGLRLTILQVLAFPKYTSAKGTNANSASAAINKWLKPRVPEACVVHSFRHSLRDRLRAVQCPSDMIDQIGGWATAGVGQSYGEGYSLKTLAEKLCLLRKFMTS